jgi:hypothetical protein
MVKRVEAPRKQEMFVYFQRRKTVKASNILYHNTFTCLRYRNKRNGDEDE